MYLTHGCDQRQEQERQLYWQNLVAKRRSIDGSDANEPSNSVPVLTLEMQFHTCSQHLTLGYIFVCLYF